MNESESSRHVKDGAADESAHNRGRKKVKQGSDPMESDMDGTSPCQSERVSYKDTLIDSKINNCYTDSRGSGVFSEAWNDYLESLKGYFGEGGDMSSHSHGDKEKQGVTTIPKLIFSREQYERWCAPWKNSLIVRLLGKKVPLWTMQSRLQKMWKTRDKYTIRDIDNGYFVISFNSEEDLNYYESPI